MKPAILMVVALLWLGAVAGLLYRFSSGKASGFGIAIGGWQGKLGLALLIVVVFGWLVPLAWAVRLLLKRN